MTKSLSKCLFDIAGEVDKVANVVKDEEKSFHRTLKNGQKKLDLQKSINGNFVMKIIKKITHHNLILPTSSRA